MAKAVVVSQKERYVSIHREPFFNLAVEPWISVQYKNGPVEDVGLRQLLLDAHLIADIEEEYPIVRAAIRRYLVGLTVQLIRLSGFTQPDEWERRVSAGTGFTATEVEALLATQAKYLWLYHPQTPFMQDMRLIDEEGNFDGSINEIVPHIPAGASESAWFDKPGELSFMRGLTPAFAARYLLARWFYIFAGNGGGGILGSPFVSVSADAPLTQVFTVDRDRGLFTSTLRNIPKSLMDHGDSSAPRGLAWADGLRPRPLGEPLYAYTLTTSSALLGPVNVDTGEILEFLRRTVGYKVPSVKATMVMARDSAKEHDPHCFWIQGKKPTDPRKMIRIGPRSDDLGILLRLRKDPEACDGVAARDALWVDTRSRSERLEFLFGSSTGAALSMKWSDLKITTVPVAYFDSKSERAQEVADAVESVITPIERDIWSTCQRAFTREGRSEAALAKQAEERAKAIWRREASEAIGAVLTHDDPIDEASMKHSLSMSAKAAVELVLTPYAASSAWAPSIIRAIEGMRIYRKGESV